MAFHLDFLCENSTFSLTHIYMCILVYTVPIKMQEQMKRIAQIYFPLIPIVLAHVGRLNSGHAPYISPMLGAASMQGGGEKINSLGTRIPSSPSATDSLPRSLPGSELIKFDWYR